MFRIKKEVSGVVAIFCLWLTACGLPAGPNTALNFANISSPTIPLSATTIDSINPQITVDGSNRIFVVWQDKANISYSYSADGGATFQAPISIFGSGGGSYPRIATDGNGNAFVIWLSAFPQNIFLNYAISNTFQQSIQVSTTSVPSPQVQVPQADIKFNTSTNTLWVSWSQCTSCSSFPTYDIYYSNVPLVGTLTQTPITSSNFVSPINITNVSNAASSVFYPKIASSGASTNILYQSTNASSLILYNTTSGTSFTLGNSSAGASNAALGIDAGGNSYIAWNLNNSPHDILFNILKMGVNSTFNTNSLNLTNNANSIGPAVAIDSSQYVYVAFFSRPAANPNAYDVFLERSTNGGKSFTDALNISNSPGDSASYAPGMAIVGKTAYVVWDDNSATRGNHQIYFKTITFN